MTQVRINHVRASGICCRGARAWFARQPGLSWDTFLQDGYSVEAIRATGCPIAAKAADAAEAEADGW